MPNKALIPMDTKPTEKEVQRQADINKSNQQGAIFLTGIIAAMTLMYSFVL